MNSAKLFLASIGILLTTQAFAGETLVLNTGTRAPYTTDDKQGFLDLVIAEVFRRTGNKAEVLVYKASARAMAQANDGFDAGFAMRVRGLEKRFKNMIMVPEKIIDNDFVALSKSFDFPTSDWQSLAGFDVAYILGWKIFERNMGDHKSVVLPKNPDQLIGLLKNDRVDIILYERWQGAWRAKNQGLRVSVHEPALASVPMYMYLHLSKAALVEKAAKALREMKIDGTYQRIIEQTLTPLGQNN